MSPATDYPLAQNQDELDRLVAYAEREAPQVELTCRLVGLGAGASAVDVGCGPLGALATLSRMVGPSGRVLGIDSSETALETAAALKARLGLGNVALLRADFLELADFAETARFDLVYCRLVLLHQPDVPRALSSLARLVRPGGFIAYQDIVDDPTYPRCHPPLPAMTRAWQLVFALFRHRGLTPDVAAHHAELAAQAGWQLVSQRGKFPVLPAADGFQIIQQLLGASRAGLEAGGLASASEVSDLLAALEAARYAPHRYWYGPLAVETVVRVPG